MISVLIAIFITELFGYCVLAVMLRNDRETGLLERVCIAYPLGSGLIAFQMFFLGLMRVPLTLTYVTIPVLIEILAIVAWLLKNNVLLVPRPSANLLHEIASPKTSLLKKIALRVLLAWAGIKLGSVFVETYLRPIYAWDSWAHWSVAAKLFYYAHNLMLDVPTADFFGRGVVSRYPSNPLFNPLSQVWFALWAGSFDEVLVKFWGPCYLLSAAIYLYCVALRETGRLTALGVLIIFMSSPLLSYHSIEVYSDFPLGIHIFFAAASFLNAMRGKQAYWSLVGLFSAQALFTKNEAPGMIFPLLLSAAVYIWMNRTRIPLWITSISLYLPLALIIPWFVFKTIYALSLVHDDQALALSYQPGVLSQFVHEVFTLQNFNVVLLFLPILVLLAILSRGLTKEVIHLLLPVACYSGFFILVYSFMPGYYQWAFNGVQFYRNTLTFYPTVCLLITLLIPGLWKKPSPAIITKSSSRSPRAGSIKKSRTI